MAMNIILDFKEIVRQYVAPHKRQPSRLSWLWALVDLETVWEAFSEWRAYYRYKVHVTSQHKSLQGHLIKTFGTGIRVRSYEDEFLDVGLDMEPAHCLLRMQILLCIYLFLLVLVRFQLKLRSINLQTKNIKSFKDEKTCTGTRCKEMVWKRSP